MKSIIVFTIFLVILCPFIYHFFFKKKKVLKLQAGVLGKKILGVGLLEEIRSAAIEVGDDVLSLIDVESKFETGHYFVGVGIDFFAEVNQEKIKEKGMVSANNGVEVLSFLDVIFCHRNNLLANGFTRVIFFYNYFCQDYYGSGLIPERHEIIFHLKERFVKFLEKEEPIVSDNENTIFVFLKK